MNTDIQIFNNPNFGEVRITEIDGKIMFAATEIATCLGYENPRDAILYHCKSGNVEKRYVAHDNGIGGVYVNFIPEGEVYRLIIHSKLKEAEKFQDWVFDEVLPSIRKTGGYLVSKADETSEELISRALIVAQATLDRQKQRVQILEGENEQLTAEIKKLAPRAEYTDKVLQSDSTYTMTQVAKELGMSAVKLERKLHEKGIMFRQSGQWMLYAKYQGKGYTKSRTHTFTHSDGTRGTNTITVWTETGRASVHWKLEPEPIASAAETFHPYTATH
jgi:prophage antirepressor-like protein